VKTSIGVAIKHGWKTSMNITPWDYMDHELTRLSGKQCQRCSVHA